MKYNPTKYPNIFTYETRKGKRYYIRRSYKLNGKKKEATKSNLKTIQEARSALAEIELKIENNEFDTNKNITTDLYWELYSTHKIETGQWAPDTIVNKEGIYSLHFKKKYGDQKLSRIDRLEYSNYISSFLKTHSRDSVKLMHNIFNAMMNDALKNKYIKDNPIDGIYIGESVKKKQNKHISMAEFKLFDKTAREMYDDYEYTIVRIDYFGKRRSEVNGIRLGEMHKREDGRYELHSKSSRTRLRHDGIGMKTDKSERVTVFDMETSQYIEKAIQTSHAIAKKYGRILGPDDFLFLSDYKGCKKYLRGKPIPPERLNTLFRKVSQEIGINITPHMMRHFFATQGQIAGVPIAHMAAALGHSTSYMTQKYTHIKDEVSESVTEGFMKAIK